MTAGAATDVPCGWKTHGEQGQLNHDQHSNRCEQAAQISHALIEERRHELVVTLPPEPLSLQADATRCLGITGFLRAADLADAWNTPLSSHCAPALHLPVALSAPRLAHMEWFHDHKRFKPNSGRRRKAGGSAGTTSISRTGRI